MIPVKINIPDIINIIGTDAHAYPLGANIKSRSNLLSGINIAMAMQRTNGSISVRKVFLIHADMPIANVANVTPANKTKRFICWCIAAAVYEKKHSAHLAG